MADYSKLSDAELLAMVQPKSAAPKDYSKLSDDELMGIVQPSTASDAYKSFDSGVASGAATLLGSVGDVTNLGAKGIEKASDWVSEKLGLPKYQRPETPGPVTSFLNKIPTSESVGKEIQNRYYNGEAPYEPQTKTGKYAHKIGEFAPSIVVGPGGPVAKALATVGGGAGSEAGGDVAENVLGKSARPYGELVGGFAGAMSPTALARTATPLPASVARQRLVDVLGDEGVTSLTAGQRTGSKALQYGESILGDAPGAGQSAANIQRQGQEQFTQATMRRAGQGLQDATPETLAANNQRLGDQFRDLSARNNLVPDNQMITDLTAAVQRYRRIPNSQQAQMLQGYIDDIIPHINAGIMPGVEYQPMRSMLSTDSNAVRQTDPYLSRALRDMRNALDNAMERSIPAGSADAQLWRDSRREYSAQKTIEKAASRAGEATAEGQIVPANLRNTASAENRGAYARGEGQFSELARSGSGIMAPLPNSGTGQRNLLTDFAKLPITATVGRALMSRPAQAYLGNQAFARVLENLPPARQALLRALVSHDRAHLLDRPSQ